MLGRKRRRERELLSQIAGELGEGNDLSKRAVALLERQGRSWRYWLMVGVATATLATALLTYLATRDVRQGVEDLAPESAQELVDRLKLSDRETVMEALLGGPTFSYSIAAGAAGTETPLSYRLYEPPEHSGLIVEVVYDVLLQARMIEITAVTGSIHLTPPPGPYLAPSPFVGGEFLTNITSMADLNSAGCCYRIQGSTSMRGAYLKGMQGPSGATDGEYNFVGTYLHSDAGDQMMTILLDADLAGVLPTEEPNFLSSDETTVLDDVVLTTFAMIDGQFFQDSFTLFDWFRPGPNPGEVPVQFRVDSPLTSTVRDTSD